VTDAKQENKRESRREDIKRLDFSSYKKLNEKSMW
jgi:hypothetical protein